MENLKKNLNIDEFLPSRNGFLEHKLDSWGDYLELSNSLKESSNFIFRGQCDSSWELIPTLTRHLAVVNKRFIKLSKAMAVFKGGGDIGEDLIEEDRYSVFSDLFVTDKEIEAHLERFKKSIQGMHDDRPEFFKSFINIKNEVWALGQHYGLGTPLLDWTTSPLIAAFFAFEPKKDPDSSQGERVVYAIDKTKLDKLKVGESKVELFEPSYNGNKRLAAQSGLFTYVPNGVCLNELVKRCYKDVDGNEYVLIKLIIPGDDRDGFLRLLNSKENINNSSLYPDLIGVSRHCNLHFEIDDY